MWPWPYNYRIATTDMDIRLLTVTGRCTDESRSRWWQSTWVYADSNLRSTRHSSDSTAFEAPVNLSQHGVNLRRISVNLSYVLFNWEIKYWLIDWLIVVAATVQSYAALSIGVICLLIGVPIWWKTTEVYRVPLPYSEIAALADLRVILFTTVFVTYGDYVWYDASIWFVLL